ncbi:MAG: hypothetical protein ABFD08_07770 [Syntrophomonas sp.]
MYKDIIAIASPKHLVRFDWDYGIPTTFWIAHKEAFPDGTPPTLLYEDSIKRLVAVEIYDHPQPSSGSDNEMLFKLLRRTIWKLKGELLKIWEGADIDYCSFREKFLAVENMTREQRSKLRHLNSRLVDLQKQLRKQFEWAEESFPGHCKWAKIHFILAENDPDYSEDDDNIIVTFDEDFVPEDDGRSWNDHPQLTYENGTREYHCWFYHQLYDHTGLVWEDILRIGKIWVQFRVNFDIDFDIYESKARI